MALINCSECGKEKSSEALFCPHCGLPKPEMAALSRMSRPAFWGFEWKSKTVIAGWPLVHVAVGRSKTTGKLLTAKGIVAIGQFAVGIITIAQFGIGVLFGFGQFVAGILALGQFAAGFTVIAQFGIGVYVLAQTGWGLCRWTMAVRDQAAVEFFAGLWRLVSGGFGS